MPRNWSEAVPESNGPIPQQEEFESGQPTLADVYRIFAERFERQRKGNKSFLDEMDMLSRKMDKLLEEMEMTDQRLVSLEQDAWQPRLAIEADGPADEKTRERTEGAAKAVQAMYGNSCSANRVDSDPMCSTSLGGDSTGPPALPCLRGDALVANGAAAPKSCLSPLEMRTTAAVTNSPPAKLSQRHRPPYTGQLFGST